MWFAFRSDSLSTFVQKRHEVAAPGYSDGVSGFLTGRLGEPSLSRAVGLGHDLDVALEELAELAKTCGQQQLPGHRGRDNARGRGEAYEQSVHVGSAASQWSPCTWRTESVARTKAMQMEWRLLEPLDIHTDVTATVPVATAALNLAGTPA